MIMWVRHKLATPCNKLLRQKRKHTLPQSLQIQLLNCRGLQQVQDLQGLLIFAKSVAHNLLDSKRHLAPVYVNKVLFYNHPVTCGNKS